MSFRSCRTRLRRALFNDIKEKRLVEDKQPNFITRKCSTPRAKAGTDLSGGSKEIVKDSVLEAIRPVASTVIPTHVFRLNRDSVA